MKFRAIGALAFLGSVWVLVFAIWDLAQTESLARFLPVFKPGADVNAWTAHWRISAISRIVAALAGMAAAIGLFLRQRWSAALLALVSAGWLVFTFSVNAIGYAAYPPESVDPIQAVLVAILAIASLVACVRWVDEEKPQ